MKSAQTSAEKSEQADGLTIRLNRAKHANPPSVFRALNIPTSLTNQDIRVSHEGGKFWVGTDGAEYCYSLGHTVEQAQETIISLHLPA